MSAFVGLFLRLLNWLPDALAIRIAALAATSLIKRNADIARVSRINIRHCFPELDSEAEQARLHDSLLHSALLPFELAYLQHRPINKLLAKIIAVDGEQLLKEAWQEGNGVLLLMPHFGCWEFLSVYLGHGYSISALYDPPNVAALEASMLNMRERQGATMHPTNAAGLRGLMRGLKAGNVVVVLPDQVPTSTASATVAPFFERQALTMLLAKRLLKVGSPQVLMAAAWRDLSAGDIRYRLSFERPPAEIYDEDDGAHAAAMNTAIEKIVRRDPAQYQWSYKRFRRLGKETLDLYRRQ
ncbi:MAG: lipid A biosynthesis acyltransferase [Proteobacteria bacterium]|nr:lipid A biosynthesis acyltransferase [Pseudomonadota bacterium]